MTRGEIWKDFFKKTVLTVLIAGVLFYWATLVLTVIVAGFSSA